MTVRRQEQQQRSGNKGSGFSSQPGRTPHEHNAQQNTQQNFQHTPQQGMHKENNYNKNYYRDRDNTQRQSYQNRNSLNQSHNYHQQNSLQHGSLTNIAAKVKIDETVEDIKADINRIEKEIELEIKEIRSMRSGL